MLSPGKSTLRKESGKERKAKHQGKHNFKKNSAPVEEQIPDHEKRSDHGREQPFSAIPLVKTQVACKFLWTPTKNRAKSPADVFITSSDDTKKSKIMEVLGGLSKAPISSLSNPAMPGALFSAE